MTRNPSDDTLDIIVNEARRVADESLQRLQAEIDRNVARKRVLIDEAMGARRGARALQQLLQWLKDCDFRELSHEDAIAKLEAVRATLALAAMPDPEYK
jgi:hypothetical protein